MSEYECPFCKKTCGPHGHPGCSKSYLMKTDKNGNMTCLDLDPIEAFISQLDRRVEDKKFFTGALEEHKLLQSMNEEQLRYLVPMLAHKVEYYARLWNESFKPSHNEFVEKLRKVREIAKGQGIDLWPELEGKAK